jgi:hypothetical protein
MARWVSVLAQQCAQADQPNRGDFRRLDALNRLFDPSIIFGWLA